MTALRTLPEALTQAAAGDCGYTFAAAGFEITRSYAEIQQEAFRVARSLREAGLGRGDLVGLAIADAEAFVTALFGASIAGVIPASLYPPGATTDPARYVEQTATILRHAQARALVVGDTLADGFDDIRHLCPALEMVLPRHHLNAPPLTPDARPSLDDIAFVQFTSGATSSPKGVALTHRSLCANVDAINGPSGLGTTSADVAVSWLPLYHDMGLIGMTLGPLYVARPGVLLPSPLFVKRPVEWLRAIMRHRGTISFGPNFAYDLCVRRIRDRDLEGIDLSSWRVAGCGAEPVHAPTLAAFAQRFEPAGFRATAWLPSYGLAEHVLAATFPPRGRDPRVEQVDADQLARDRQARLARSGHGTVPIVSCGCALPDHAIRIVGEDGRELGDRAVGEIVLAGPSVMAGYYNDERQTAETVRDGWLYTGDLGYLSGGELFVCGRSKDTIVVNGRKHHPQDLEWAIQDVPGVRSGRTVAFGVADGGRPDRVVIVVEAHGTALADEIAEAVRRRVGDVFGLVVDDVVVAPGGTIGRTTSGKVRRAETKALYEAGELHGNRMPAR